MWALKRLKDHIARSTQELGWTVHFGVFAFLLAVTMPRLVRSFSPTWDKLDTSWAWMLAYALQHRLQWGSTILFTYGPLGFLARSYFYSDHLLWGLSATARLASWFILGLGFACILGRIVPDRRPLARTTLPVVIGWIVGASFVHLAAQSAFLGVLLMVLAISEESTPIAVVALTLSGALLALGSLIKSTALIVSLFSLLIYPPLCWYARCRRLLPLSFLPLLSFFISFCALWLLSSQSLAHLPAYFLGTWAIASGYTPAMSIPGMRIQVVSALVISALLTAALVGLLVRRRRVRAAQCLLLGVMGFWAWKEGFSRQDWGYFRHPMIFYGSALLIASVGTVLLTTEKTWQSRFPVYAAYGVALWSSMQGYQLSSLTFPHVLDNYAPFVDLITSRSSRLLEQHSETEAIRKEFQLTKGTVDAVGNKSVDVIPWSLMMAQGYHMRLVASPVFQAYSAYTPYLDQLNARQIWNGGADKIIYSYRTIDLRYPAFDEPATFRAILHCYRTEYPGIRYSVLTRVACARPQMLAVGIPVKGALGRWIAVPRQASYVDIKVRTNLIGHVIDVLYKPDPVWLYFKLADGRRKGPYRFVYPLGTDGLFIRYFLPSQPAADVLLAGSTRGLRRISAIRLSTRPPLPPGRRLRSGAQSRAYGRHFSVRFFRAARPRPLPLPAAGHPPATRGRRP